MHSIILIIAYRLNDKFMLSILLMDRKILTSIQQKHELSLGLPPISFAFTTDDIHT